MVSRINASIFGISSLIVGSLLVTLGAAFIAVPLGIMAALYISEVAAGFHKRFSKVRH